MFRIDILWIQQYFLYLKSGWQIQIPYVGNQILKFVSWNQNWKVISETFFWRNVKLNHSWKFYPKSFLWFLWFEYYKEYMCQWFV